MQEFFQGWKRKLGVITLLMACGFAGGWVRSGIVSDDLLIRLSPKGHEALQSGQGRLLWGSFIGKRGVHTIDTMHWVMPEWSSKRIAPSDVSFFGIFESMPDGWHIFGAGRYESTRHYPLLGQATTAVWVIPYWMLVIPLAALSACMLLGRYRMQEASPGRPLHADTAQSTSKEPKESSLEVR